jgi:three-Cys-motif partner protein
MAKDSDPIKWDYPRHTQVKHELLEKYLGGWLPILGSWHKKLVIFDGFAGRGEYVDGSAGSPVILLQKADELLSAGKVEEVVCAFVERDPNNFENLREVLQRIAPLHPSVTVFGPRNEAFEDVVAKIMGDVGNEIAPSFWFIDPFGFTGMSFSSVQQLMSLKRSEVFITLMLRDIRRFLDHPNLEQTFDRLFGTQEWREIVASDATGDAKEQLIRDLYVAQLRNLGCKVTSFRVCEDEKLATLYYLIYATNHCKGRWLMKDVMHSQGANGLFAYLGPQDQYRRLQGTLIPIDTVGELKEQLLVKLRGRTVTFDALTDESCDDNELRITDYRKALQALRAEVKITVVPVSSKTDRGLMGKDRISFPGD